jgi:hypothetical protein
MVTASQPKSKRKLPQSGDNSNARSNDLTRHLQQSRRLHDPVRTHPTFDSQHRPEVKSPNFLQPKLKADPIRLAENRSRTSRGFDQLIPFSHESSNTEMNGVTFGRVVDFSGWLDGRDRIRFGGWRLG